MNYCRSKHGHKYRKYEKNNKQSRQNNNKIKHLHERCMRLIHNDKLSSY